MKYLQGHPRIKLLVCIVAIFIAVQLINSLMAGVNFIRNYTTHSDWAYRYILCPIYP